MHREEVFEKLVEIARDVFERDDVELKETSTAADVEEWDSLAHVSLISDLEDEFEITFTLDEITNSKTLGELMDALIKHIDEK